MKPSNRQRKKKLTLPRDDGPTVEARKFVSFTNETPWRTSDLVKVFDEARTYNREQKLNDKTYFLSIEEGVPEEVVFRTSSEAGSAYYCHSFEIRIPDPSDRENTLRGIRWAVWIPSSKVDAMKLLESFDKVFRTEIPEDDLRLTVQRLRRLTGAGGVTHAEFIIQHRNRKRRVYAGRRIRSL